MDCKQKCFFWGMGEMRMRQEEVVFGWEAGKVSLQSRAKGVGRAGEESEKIPTGTRSRLWNAQRLLASCKTCHRTLLH